MVFNTKQNMRILAVLILSVISLFSCQNKTENTVIQGTVFGTYYRVIYNSEDDYQKPFDSLFFVINKSMSTYQENSDISKVNRNEIVTIDTHFTKVFQASKRIYKETHGAFDPTIGAVVNAWDFGPQGKIIDLDSVKIKNLMQSVGFDKVKLADHRIEKPQETFIDFNAIAKGYAVDVISEFLNHKNIENYLVDIGGELRVRGLNAEKNTEWRLGVENPNFDGTQSINKAFF